MIDSRKLSDLQPAAQVWCKRHIAACEARGLKVQLIQTLRDAEFQASLFAKGRTAPGPSVTKCDGYKIKSRHQSGLAWDLVPLKANGLIDWTNSDAFEVMAQEAEKLGLVAGLRWKMKDSPHFEVKA